MSMAFCAFSALVEPIRTVPSSSTSIVHLVSSMILRIILPPGPMMSRMRSGLILILVMRGAYGESSVRGLCDRGEHLAQDEHAALARLGEGVLHDLGGDARAP